MKEKLTQSDIEFLGQMEPHRLKGPKIVTHLILFTVFVFFVVSVFWAKFAIIDQSTVGEGKVIPSRQVQVIQNLEGGIVKEILVSEGMMVAQGQPLLILDDTRYLAAYNENQVKEHSLDITYMRLKAESESKPFVVTKKLMQSNPEEVAFETSLYDTRQDELQQLVDSYNLAKQEYNMTLPLVKKGAASQVEVLRLQRIITDAKGKVISFRSQTLDQLSKVKAELESLRESNEANVDRIARTTVRSPVRGVIKQLMVHTVGGVVQPGSDMVEVVPLDDTLLVEAKIKPKDIGFLHSGQTALVTITAFDYAKYGSLTGEVEQISADAIQDEKKQETYYSVKVRTHRNYLGTKQQPLYIIPGMQARVNIETGKQSVLDYILNPLINVVNKSFREK